MKYREAYKPKLFSMMSKVLLLETDGFPPSTRYGTSHMYIRDMEKLTYSQNSMKLHLTLQFKKTCCLVNTRYV
jgi:hypothetical protein